MFLKFLIVGKTKHYKQEQLRNLYLLHLEIPKKKPTAKIKKKKKNFEVKDMR